VGGRVGEWGGEHLHVSVAYRLSLAR
jgi:hypothetical protein